MSIADEENAQVAESIQAKNRVVAVSEADLPLVLQFIRDLAEYEKLAHEVVATEADLRAALFGENPCIEAVITRWDGEPAGFALYYTTFSTFVGKPGLYLEDLFVRPEFRGRGIGRTLLAHLARLVQARGYARLEWTVLDWNESAIGFYRRLGAVPLDGWRINRLEGDALARLAQEGPVRVEHGIDPQQ